MEGQESVGTCCFNELQNTNAPHLIEKIFFLLEYDSFKTCMEVNGLWSKLLKSKSYQKRARSVFKRGIFKDHEELQRATYQGNTDEVRKLLSSGMLDVDSAVPLCTDVPLPAMSNAHARWHPGPLSPGHGNDGHRRGGGTIYSAWTPLEIAAFCGHSEVVKLLIEKGADLSGRVGNPMREAVEKGNENVILLLLKAGVDPDKGDSNGKTAMHFAVYACESSSTKVLIDAGAQIDKTDNNGETALHYAAKYGKRKVFKLLVKSGADLKKVNHEGKTPIDIAVETNHYHRLGHPGHPA